MGCDYNRPRHLSATPGPAFSRATNGSAHHAGVGCRLGRVPGPPPDRDRGFGPVRPAPARPARGARLRLSLGRAHRTGHRRNPSGSPGGIPRPLRLPAERSCPRRGAHVPPVATALLKNPDPISGVPPSGLYAGAHKGPANERLLCARVAQCFDATPTCRRGVRAHGTLYPTPGRRHSPRL